VERKHLTALVDMASTLFWDFCSSVVVALGFLKGILNITVPSFCFVYITILFLSQYFSRLPE
jgi:hypothetical protein